MFELERVGLDRVSVMDSFEFCSICILHIELNRS